VPDAPIRVLVVDDHRIVREGVGLIIDRDPSTEVVGFAASGEEAVAAFLHHRPDIVLMDLQLAGMNGVEAIRHILRADPTARVIVLTMYDGDEDIHRALQAGARTYVLKDSLADDLMGVVRSVYAGQRLLPPDVQARLDDRASRPTLSLREVSVLEGVMKGHRNKEIAAAMAISEETVEVHLRNVFAKLQVHDRTAAVYVALRRGIVHLE
jgi:two-component system NarL family response regulator